MKNRKWTNEEVELLKLMFAITENKELEKKFNRNYKNISSKAYKIGLSKPNYKYSKHKRWTNEEIKQLIELFPITHTNDLAKLFNRDYFNISTKAFQLRLKKSKNHIQLIALERIQKRSNFWTLEMIQESANKYTTRLDFLINDRKAYDAAHSRTILDQVCAHMIPQQYSIAQLILNEILQVALNTKTTYNDRTQIKPCELDIYIPEFKLAFEYNGKFWHSSDAQKERDKKKSIKCTEKGIKLLIIKEKSKENYEKSVKIQLVELLSTINDHCKTNITADQIYNIKPDYKKYIFNQKKAREVCAQYTDWRLFYKKQHSLYQKLATLGLIHEYTKHMYRKSIQWRSYPMEEKITIISQFKTIKEFKKINHKLWEHCKNYHPELLEVFSK